MGKVSGLRIDERTIFDDLMDECRRYASAAGSACFPTKFEGMFLSILFAHHKALKDLRNKIDPINDLDQKSTGRTNNQDTACNLHRIVSLGKDRSRSAQGNPATEQKDYDWM